MEWRGGYIKVVRWMKNMEKSGTISPVSKIYYDYQIFEALFRVLRGDQSNILIRIHTQLCAPFSPPLQFLSSPSLLHLHHLGYTPSPSLAAAAPMTRAPSRSTPRRSATPQVSPSHSSAARQRTIAPYTSRRQEEAQGGKSPCVK